MEKYTGKVSFVSPEKVGTMNLYNHVLWATFA